MKSNRIRLIAKSLVAAVGLALAGCHSVPEATTAGPGARVVAVQGRARCSDASHSWRKLKADDALISGQLIQTAVTSSADLVVAGTGGADANRILLQSDAVLFIEGIPSEPATGGGVDGGTLKLDLRQGELVFTSPQSGRCSPCEIRFVKGLAAARGATFKLQSAGHLKVFRGVVTLKSSDEKPVRSVEAGNQYDPQTGELTPIPVGETVVPLPPPPAVRPPPPLWPPGPPPRKY